MNRASVQGHIRPPMPLNEPVKNYAPNSAERASLIATLRNMSSDRISLPCFINGQEMTSGNGVHCVMPHRHSHILGYTHNARHSDVEKAIAAARAASSDWAEMPWPQRAAIFLRAAELLAGPWRDTLNVATMLGQSKTVHQAEIDAAAELIDFWRFNVQMMQCIFADQPISPAGVWNFSDYRPLDGFVYAVTPFNFTSIAGNLPTAPALLGNTVIWKPSASAAYSAHFVMKLLKAAGLPDGVINLVHGDPTQVAEIVMSNSDFAGLHFTGSTEVFNRLTRLSAEKLGTYRAYPRLVGETGGKNFILAHESADVDAVVTAIIRGGFEYQGQKCSAASRVFLPDSLWPSIREKLFDELATVKVGDIADFSNFMGAVINEAAWTKHRNAIETARRSNKAQILFGGDTSCGEGYFIQPTVIKADDLSHELFTQELFGPIVTVYIYPDSTYEALLDRIDQQVSYGLTGAIFALDRKVIDQALQALRHAAGNFYINDKPTGAVVGQQPFGGGRASGTNDKAGSMWNLIRWLSPRSIKETFVPPRDYRYPYMS